MTTERGASRILSAAWIRIRSNLILILCLGALSTFALPGSAWSAPKDKPKPSPSRAPVTAVPARQEDVGVYMTAIGTVTPIHTVTVRTRVDGELMEVFFREGQTVRKNELLARIDPRPFEVLLLQAEGQMARDTALLQNARLDLNRYRELWKEDSIPKQQLDTQEALVRQYEGTVKSDQGQIDNAKLQLAYCSIRAPIAGRIGLRLVDPGNIVHASDAGGLLVITQIQPISVIFSIPEAGLSKVLAAIRHVEEMPVEALDSEMKERLATGTVFTIDNQIDSTTGTVRVRAVFANEEAALFPNQFVNVRLVFQVRRGAVVVPASAIQRGPAGPFVYVVKEDHTAAVRPVSVGEIQEGSATILNGVAAGEMVVTDGAARLREGASVEIAKGSRK